MTDGHGGYEPPPGYAPPPPYPPRGAEPPPGLALTIVITLFFGLFGLIPAALAAGRARRSGHPEGRYWIAFGASLAGAAAFWLASVLVLVVALSGAGPGAAAADPTGPLPGLPSIGGPVTSSGPQAHCVFNRDSADLYHKEVGMPPASVPASGTTTLTLLTNFGPVGLRLDQAKTPCAAASFVYLAQQRFFDQTPCHREVSEPDDTSLQCGDPTGSGSGGPSYHYPTHVTGHENYPRGTVAMENDSHGNDRSQFFLCIRDSQLSPDYTVVGTVDRAGLAVLDTIAANGNDGSLEPSPGGGAPTKPVTIEQATVG